MSDSGKEAKVISLRITRDIWSACQDVASRRGKSFNKFAEEALAAAARKDRADRLRAGIEQLAGRHDDVPQFAQVAMMEAISDEARS